jgi:7-carboxy-7-deazaguanine synthase
MEIISLLTRISEFGCDLVEITGGEPLLQSETKVLVSDLLKAGYEVLMETNGSLNIDAVDSRCSRIMDLKCPTSGESHRNDLNNFKRLTHNDQLKCVIGNREDYLFAKDHLERLPSDFPLSQVLFSPVSGQLPPEQLAQWILADHLKIRLQLQLHKILWPQIERGV